MFDVDEWLESAAPPRRSVTIYGRGDLLAELEEMAQMPEERAGVLGGSPRQRRFHALREQVEASRRVLHVRALEEEERAEIAAKHTKPSSDGEGELDGFAYETEAYALALVRPQMTIDQVAKMRHAIGDAQWREIGTAITKASVEGISVPLSRLGSDDTQES
jgi:hypothetical protein